MIAPRLPNPPPSTAFLVERYLRASDLNALSAAVGRLARLCADPGPRAGQVRYVQSVHLPAEDTCFCLLRAPSARAVRDINRLAGFEFDRITEATLLFPHPNPTSPEEDIS